jgi:hypothetical protein
MPSPDMRRASVAYYVAFVLLVVALGVTAALFYRAFRQSSVRAEITVAEATPVDCPTGERAPACFEFEVRNLGPEATEVECHVVSGDAPFAEFLTGGDTFTYSPELLAGLSFTMVTKVQPGVDQTVRAPAVSCAPA